VSRWVSRKTANLEFTVFEHELNRRSGRRGRGFKSRHLDHGKSLLNAVFTAFRRFLFYVKIIENKVKNVLNLKKMGVKMGVKIPL
jgi:hypothetical protein